WSLAKRKAARQLMLPENQGLPGDDEITAALSDHHALFGRDTHAPQLLRQREQALRWMLRLAEFAPVLSGGVAAGWATAHSPVRLELVAADAKAVEMVLLNAGVAYRSTGNDRDGASELVVDDGEAPVRLSIRTPEQARQRSRKDGDVRLTTSELRSLLT
ncbi:MAG: hypothetical protein IT518_11105, partial [Burkholderiales bacterium]|nr:hypothetical protein [Burkholderiales bacterium]